MASLRLKLVSPLSLLLLLITLFSQTHLCFSLRFSKLSLNLQSITTVTETTADVHDLLPHYGLPKGLIPNNVDSFTLFDDGTFTLQLSSPCYVQFDQLVYYGKKISGKLGYGSVSSVSGIQAKKLFLWVSVTGIQADKDSDMIEFYVGSLSKKLPTKQFEDVPVCMTKACTGTTTATNSESIYAMDILTIVV